MWRRSSASFSMRIIFGTRYRTTWARRTGMGLESILGILRFSGVTTFLVMAVVAGYCWGVAIDTKVFVTVH